MRLLIRAGGRSIAVEGEAIVEPDGRFDLVLDFSDAEIRPGLINAHDHLHRNHYGRLGRPPYANACNWAADIQHRYRRRIAHGRRLARRDALMTGAWKNLFAGVTTVVHHDPWEEDFERDFPLRVLRIRNADSIGMGAMLDSLGGDGPYSLHLAEGVDSTSADEIRQLARQGLLTPQLLAVHAVGLDPDGIACFRDAGAALVWCPSSNLFLFGRTAPDRLLRDGVDVLLGSDSLLTGGGDLLDELRCARARRALDDDRLEGSVGRVAAARLGLRMPTLDPGARADLVVLARPLFEASVGDVLLVIAGGTPRVAAPALAPVLARHFGPGREMRLGAVTRWTNESTRGEEFDDATH